MGLFQKDYLCIDRQLCEIKGGYITLNGQKLKVKKLSDREKSKYLSIIFDKNDYLRSYWGKNNMYFVGDNILVGMDSLLESLCRTEKQKDILESLQDIKKYTPYIYTYILDESNPKGRCDIGYVQWDISFSKSEGFVYQSRILPPPKGMCAVIEKERVVPWKQIAKLNDTPYAQYVFGVKIERGAVSESFESTPYYFYPKLFEEEAKRRNLKLDFDDNPYIEDKIHKNESRVHLNRLNCYFPGYTKFRDYACSKVVDEHSGEINASNLSCYYVSRKERSEIGNVKQIRHSLNKHRDDPYEVFLELYGLEDFAGNSEDTYIADNGLCYISKSNYQFNPIDTALDAMEQVEKWAEKGPIDPRIPSFEELVYDYAWLKERAPMISLLASQCDRGTKFGDLVYSLEDFLRGELDVIRKEFDYRAKRKLFTISKEDFEVCSMLYNESKSYERFIETTPTGNDRYRYIDPVKEARLTELAADMERRDAAVRAREAERVRNAVNETRPYEDTRPWSPIKDACGKGEDAVCNEEVLEL